MKRYGEVYEAVAATLGDAQATALCAQFGGMTIYIPEAPRPDHPIAAHISLETLALLSRRYGRTVIYIPMGPTTAAARSRSIVWDAIKDGCSIMVAARRAGVSITTARRIKRLAGAATFNRP